MKTPTEKQILEEAVRLFLQLEASPDNQAFLAERESFLARGEKERAAYRKAIAGWQATGIKPRSKKPIIAILAAVLGAAAFYSAEPLRIALLADISTGRQTSQGSLNSGDLVFLDAGSALVDNTEPGGQIRATQVLKGAAFFDVTRQDRPFRVTLGEITVEAIGTAFETSFQGDNLSVAVAEGIVRVTGPTQSWQLDAGDRFLWSDGAGAMLPEVEPSAVATWRQDQLVVQNIPVRQVADILDRRIAGDVVLLGSGFDGKTISGNFDLTDPIAALKVLAATQNATIVPGRPVVTLLLARD